MKISTIGNIILRLSKFIKKDNTIKIKKDSDYDHWVEIMSQPDYTRCYHNITENPDYDHWVEIMSQPDYTRCYPNVTEHPDYDLWVEIMRQAER
jgi:uncharacterized short protein YbdD (DUF466 family)